MKIGLITHNYPITHTERKDAGIFLYDFAHELARHHSVYVLSPDFGGKKERYNKVPVTWFDWGSDGSKLGDWKITSPSTFIKFARLIYLGQKEALRFAEKIKLITLLRVGVFLLVCLHTQ